MLKMIVCLKVSPNSLLYIKFGYVKKRLLTSNNQQANCVEEKKR